MSDPRNALRNLGGSVDSHSVGTGIPSVPPLEHAGLSSFLSAVKNWMGKLSTGPGRAVTLTDLTQAGLGSVGADGEFVFAPSEDSSSPPAPIGIQVASSAMSNMVSWTPPAGYDKFGYAEVWRGTDEVMSDAGYVGETSSAVYLDVLTSQNDLESANFKTYYYRVRFVSRNGVPGPWNAALGTASTATLIDNSFIGNLHAAKINAGTIAAGRLDAQVITTKALYNDLGVIKVGIIQNAHIGDAQITSAKIGDAQITTAKIADVLQSSNYSANAGWQITKDGTMTFNGGSFSMRSASSSARLEIVGDCIKVFDSAGALRVKIGNLAA